MIFIVWLRTLNFVHELGATISFYIFSMRTTKKFRLLTKPTEKTDFIFALLIEMDVKETILTFTLNMTLIRFFVTFRIYLYYI